MSFGDLQTGDVLFVEGKGFISEAIKKVTKSKVSHVGIIYNSKLIFETHYNTNARLNPITKTYKGKKVSVYRPITVVDVNRLQELCEEYNGTRYSKWDIFTNFIFSWLPAKKRRTVVAGLGTKKMAICSEMTAKILYEYSKSEFPYLYIYEGLRPEGLKEIGIENNWKLVFEGVVK